MERRDSGGAGGHLPTARDIAAVLFREGRLVVVSFLIVVIAIISYWLCFPSYRAEMKLLVGKGRVDPPVAPQPTALSEYSRYEVSEEEINSEVQLLQDADVLRPVVLAAGLNHSVGVPWLHARNDDEAQITRAVRQLASSLTVMPVRKTRLISIRYESGDPETAARVLRELSSVYLQKHQAAHRPAGESTFFQQQRDSYSKALSDAENRLLGLIQKGAVSPSIERDLTLQKLSDADTRYRQLLVQNRETEERIRALNASLATLPERRTTEIQTGDNPQLLEQLKSTLLKLELKKIELLTKYQPNYRLVQQVEQQIGDTRTAIANESAAPLRQEATNNDPRHDWAASELEKAEVEHAALHASELGAAALVSYYQRQAESFGTQTIEEQRLQRSAKVAEENYLLYVRKREEARIEDALDREGILNVSLVQSPTVPALPKWSLTLVSVFAVFTGTMFSIALAFAADYLNPGYRTPEEVSMSLGVPVLASLPRQAA